MTGKEKRARQEKLSLWQGRLNRNETAYESDLSRMDERESLYRGSDVLKTIVAGEKKTKTPHVRNICTELIEAQVDSNIPQPKVTARRQKDEKKAKLIEDMIRGELDRMHFEELNDMMERTVPIQGGAAFLVEWDNTQRSHSEVGEIVVTALHPKQIVPQDGVYTGVETMDYIILKVPQTKDYIRRRYGVDVTDQTEEEPEVKGAEGKSAAEDMVTQYIAYYRNDKGGIGLYSWVGNTQVEDLEDYQARRLRRCAMCDAIEPMNDTEPLEEPTLDGSYPGEKDGALPEVAEDWEPEKVRPRGNRGGRKTCPYCGASEWKSAEVDYEEVYFPVEQPVTAPGEMPFSVQENGMGLPAPGGVQTVTRPEKVPFYKPNIYPVLLQKNVSVFGQFLGDSDIDKIADQQNTTNRIEAKIIDKLLKSGSYITLPDEASIKVDADDMKVIRPGNAAAKQLIDVYDLEGNVSQDMAYLAQVYEEARQVIGITDSFQGRADRTATSGKAKEFAAAQSAGRLESKRVMKDAVYAALFEAIFKFKLAYADEPRPVLSTDINGNTTYEEFDRYDFLERDEAGEWFWNDQFLFSCDNTAPLASNREAMWQETRMNLQTGAFGNPEDPRTLILFWTKMELLHYPGAGETKTYLEEELKRQEWQRQMEMQMQQMQMQMQAQAQMAARQMPVGQPMGRSGMDESTMQAVVQQARADAARDAAGM